MVEVRPFRGLRFGVQAGSDLTALLSPPYDVLSPQDQESLHQRSPHNIVRLELGKIGPQDTPEDNRYTRARVLLSAWRREGVLLREEQPAFYLCRHRFQYLGVERTRWELLVQVRLAEWDERVVLPHERTLPEPKVDRLNLLRALKTNTAPLWSLYSDPAASLEALLQEQARSAPLVEVPRWHEAAFDLWAINDPQQTEQIRRHFAASRLYMADGHHRYETALAYRNEQRAAHPEASGEEGFNYVFMSLTSLSDPGLLILPIHRLVRGVSQEQTEVLKRQLAAEWELESSKASVSTLELDVRQALSQGRGDTPRFGVYGLEPGKLLLFRPRSLSDLQSRLSVAGSAALRSLDVTLLHEIVLHGYLAVGREAHQVEAALAFTHSAQEAVQHVDTGEYQLAFLVNPTRVEQVVTVADAGEKMPQKSTFFYPKLPVGLVLSPLESHSPP